MSENKLGLYIRGIGNGYVSPANDGYSEWRRVSRATAALPQTTAETLVTITGGRVILANIIGEVTTVIQTQADNAKLVFNPTEAGASTDICAVLNITAKAVGTLFSITGTVATALQSGLWLTTTMATPLILSEGTIDLDCAASNTGSVQWDVYYLPLDEGATVA